MRFFKIHRYNLIFIIYILIISKCLNFNTSSLWDTKSLFNSTSLWNTSSLFNTSSFNFNLTGFNMTDIEGALNDYMKSIGLDPDVIVLICLLSLGIIFTLAILMVKCRRKKKADYTILESMRKDEKLEQKDDKASENINEEALQERSIALQKETLLKDQEIVFDNVKKVRRKKKKRKDNGEIESVVEVIEDGVKKLKIKKKKKKKKLKDNPNNEENLFDGLKKNEFKEVQFFNQGDGEENNYPDNNFNKIQEDNFPNTNIDKISINNQISTNLKKGKIDQNRPTPKDLEASEIKLNILNFIDKKNDDISHAQSDSSSNSSNSNSSSSGPNKSAGFKFKKKTNRIIKDMAKRVDSEGSNKSRLSAKKVVSQIVHRDLVHYTNEDRSSPESSDYEEELQDQVEDLDESQSRQSENKNISIKSDTESQGSNSSSSNDSELDFKIQNRNMMNSNFKRRVIVGNIV
jgi:hypothetical protein